MVDFLSDLYNIHGFLNYISYQTLMIPGYGIF